MDVHARLASAVADRYRLDREIGVGGMATVYLARDVRHQRQVAIKVLHPELSAVIGTERFLQEIELTAQLQHPHILPLFDSGEADGLLYYVMPYVEGESLRARLERERQLPVADTLRIASEVADALDYAHRRGLVHRDVKPENILLHEGRAQVADFGIALAVQHATGTRLTQTGLSLGTPHYMAPEQAMGERGTDARADVYALGAMVYEMLAGEPPFTGASSPAVLVRVLTEPPRSVRVHRPQVPEHVDAALARALQKLPADRWQTARELSEALQGTRQTPLTAAAVGAGDDAAAAHAGPRRHRLARRLFAAAALAIILLQGFGLWSLARRPPPSDGPAVRFPLVPGEHEGVIRYNFAVAPDGRAVAYLTGPVGSASTSETRWYVRRINEPLSRLVPGSQGASSLVFDPTGRWLAFAVGNELYRVSIDGGSAQRIATVASAAGLAWAGETIVIGTRTGGLQRVAATGGVPVPLTVPDSGQVHTEPVALADGVTILFSDAQPSGPGLAPPFRIGVASLATGSHAVLDVEGIPIGYAAGLLIYYHRSRTETGLAGVPFDLRRWQIGRDPIPLLDGVQVAVLSPSGSLIYMAGLGLLVESELVAVSLEGAAHPLSPLRRRFVEARYSPDGRRAAVTITTDSISEIWVHDLASGTLQVITRGVDGHRPEWLPDGRNLLYASSRLVTSPRQGQGSQDIFRQPADGSGGAELLQPYAAHAQATRDGATLVVRAGGGTAVLGNDLYFRPLAGDTVLTPLAVSPSYVHSNPAISPDGRWIVFPSDETGSWQLYLQSFPGPGPRYPITVDGGDHAVWAPDGSRIYYSLDTRMYEAVIGTTPTVTVSRRLLFELPGLVISRYNRSWDLAPDGSHFLAPRLPSAESDRLPELVVIHNWVADLRARLGTRF
jgi:eukaryotic-like serine/threonine-protein kinase